MEAAGLATEWRCDGAWDREDRANCEQDRFPVIGEAPMSVPKEYDVSWDRPKFKFPWRLIGDELVNRKRNSQVPALEVRALA